MNKPGVLLALMLFLLPGAGLRAEVNSVRLAGSNQADCWSLETIVRDVTGGITGDRQRALALHRFGMAHQIHFIGPFEGGDYVNDALKMLSVYGYNLCGGNSTTMCALYELAGLAARRRGGSGHVIPEVWFEGKWNYIDTDMFGYVYLPDDTTMASVDELIENPDLWLREGRRPEPFYPWDPPDAMRKAFVNAPGWIDYHSYSLAHIMRLSLRTGERVTCFYRPRDRFYLDGQAFPHKLTTQWRNYWLQGPVRQNSMAWTDTIPAAYGNALIEYEPDLRSRAFRLENPGMQGVKVNSGDELPPLTTEMRGATASLEVDVPAPWVIAGLQNDLTDFSDDTDGAVVSGWFWRIEDDDVNRISVSVDNGRNWATVWENRHLGAVPFEVDLTRYTRGRYGYRVRFEWADNGGSGRVGLEGLRLRTWCELSPMALPRLESGTNRMTLSTGPHRAVLEECYWNGDQSLPGQSFANLARADEEPLVLPLDPERPGTLEFTPGVEGIIDELRFSVEVRPLPDGDLHDVRLKLFLSETGGRDWEKLAEFEPHREQTIRGMVFNHVVDGRSFNGAATRLRLEVNRAALNKVTVNCLERVTPTVPNTLEVTHAYHRRGGGTVRKVQWSFPPGAQNTSYEVDVAADEIINDYFVIEAVEPD